MATRWTTASTPASAGARVSGRVTSPIRVSTARAATRQPAEHDLARGRRPDERDDPMTGGEQARDERGARRSRWRR